MPNNLAETPNEVRNIKLKPTTVRAHTHTLTHVLTANVQLQVKVYRASIFLLSAYSVNQRRTRNTKKNPIQSEREWAPKVNKM